MKIISIKKIKQEDNWVVVIQERKWYTLWLKKYFITYCGYSNPFINLKTKKQVDNDMAVFLAEEVWYYKHNKKLRRKNGKQ